MSPERCPEKCHAPTRAWRAALAALGVAGGLAGSMGGCLSFDFAVDVVALPPADQLSPLGAAQGVDLLIVGDNSGSMQLHAESLRAALFKPECPIRNLLEVPLDLREPNAELRAELAQRCGLTLLLAAYDIDMNIAVLTMDMALRDLGFPVAQLLELATAFSGPGTEGDLCSVDFRGPLLRLFDNILRVTR